ITGATDFITGLTDPRAVDVDQVNNVLYYNNFGIEDIRSSNLTTGAFVANVITTGAMAGFYDFAFSDNAGGIIAVANYEVNGVYYIPWNNNDSGNETRMDLGGLSYDVYYGVAIDDGNEYVYLSNALDGRIYRTGFSGGSMITMATLSEPSAMAYDRFNNDLYIINYSTQYELYRLDLDGGALTQLFALGTTEAMDIQ